MFTRVSLRAGLLVTCFIAFGTAAAQDPALEHAQLLMHQFQTNKASVAYAAGMAVLRNDLNSRAKPGKTVEVTLTNDFHFNDGTLLNKGTVIAGTVNAATNRSKANPESSIVVDWTSAHLPKGVILPIAAAVRDAEGNAPVQGADHTFGQNQLGATANSGHAGDNNTTMNNSVLMNKQAGMPQIAPGVTMEPAEGHSLRVTSTTGDIVLNEGTKLVLVLFKDRGPAATKP
jgi:hypothetical protein